MLILYNKPYHVLSQYNSNPDYPKHKTLAECGLPVSLEPVGRLDYDSEGFLLLSNDPKVGEMLHPKFKHPRTYLVQVDGAPSNDSLELLRKGGLEIRVGKKGHTCLPVEVRILESAPDWLWERNPAVDESADQRSSWIELTLREGKNRQVRRMMAKIGCPTLRLIRTSILEYKLGTLKPGEWKKLGSLKS